MRSFYSFYLDTTKIALQSIFAHKLRAFLTLIGIIIGVASVVLVGASINGLNTCVVDKISKVLGANHFMIDRMASSERLSDEEWDKRDKRNKKLEWSDLEWVNDHCDSCQTVGAQVSSSVDMEHEGHQIFGTRIYGVTANMAEIEDKTIPEGQIGR